MLRRKKRYPLLIAIAPVLLLSTICNDARAQEQSPQTQGDGTSDIRSLAGAMQDLLGWPSFWTIDILPLPSSAFDVIPDPAEAKEPYAHWHRHTGLPADCVASLRLRQPGREDVFVSGLVIRCDGFILVPRSSYGRIQSGAVGDVIITGAEGETITRALPIAGWEKIRSRSGRVDFALLKVNDHHIRCLPMLAAVNVRDGGAVSLVYAKATSTPSAETCSAITLHATVGPSSDHGIHFSIASETTADGKRVDPTTVPPGTSVIDQETGAAVGIVTSDGASFSTFARFNDEFAEVGLAPSRDAIRLLRAPLNHSGEGSAQDPQGNIDLRHPMSLIPGGPVTLSGEAREYALANFGTDIACTPDFQVDDLPTTNEDYRAWLKSTAATAPLPTTWPITELEHPTLISDMPATGVAPNAAQSYLKSRDKRLLTNVEWDRASKVKDLHWFEKIWRSWENTDTEFVVWDGLQRVYYWALAFSASGLYGVNLDAERYAYLHNGLPSPQQAAADVQTIEKAINRRLDFELKTKTFPRYVHRVGSIPEDASVYGVSDVTLNAPELVLAPDMRPQTGNKPFADCIDPNLSSVTFTRVRNPATDGPSIDDRPIVAQGTYSNIALDDGIPFYYQLHFWRYKTGSTNMDRLDFKKVPHATGPRQAPGDTTAYLKVWSKPWTLQWNNEAVPEFRGAR